MGPGALTENITTRGVDLVAMPPRARLSLGEFAIVEVTGLRNPLKQLDLYQSGFLKAILDRSHDSYLIRKAGIKAIVQVSRAVRLSDRIVMELPLRPFEALDRV